MFVWETTYRLKVLKSRRALANRVVEAAVRAENHTLYCCVINMRTENGCLVDVSNPVTDICQT